jgi:hypothetical protein
MTTLVAPERRHATSASWTCMSRARSTQTWLLRLRHFAPLDFDDPVDRTGPESKTYCGLLWLCADQPGYVQHVLRPVQGYRHF